MNRPTHEILVVDDRRENLQLLNSFLVAEGYRVRSALNGPTALMSIEAKKPDLILLDIRMDGMDGFEVCRKLKADPETADIPIIFISARDDTEAKVEAFRAGGVDYVAKPFANEEVIARVRTHLQLTDYQHNLEKRIEEGLAEIRNLNEELELTQDEMIRTLGALMEKRDDETGQHVVRVAEFSKRLAELYGLDEETTKLIYQAAPLHDAGKVAIPDAILNKPGAFDEEEWEIMKTHSMKGYEVFKDSTRPILKMAATIAKEHHEQWDGKGYPDGLKGEEISIAGRIVFLSDVFDALSHKRVYKEAWSLPDVRAFIAEQSGRMFDPRLVALFLEHFDEFVAIRDRFQN